MLHTGGPAFPHIDSGLGRFEEGMTLRDYFAASVIHGLIPQYREMFMDNTLDDWVGDAIPSLAQDAYMIADAMLMYREQK